jgi:hypothetical protein
VKISETGAGLDDGDESDGGVEFGDEEDGVDLDKI